MPTEVFKAMGTSAKEPENIGGYFRVNIGLLNYGGFKYDSGEVVECKNDLTKHNTKGAPEKFTRIDKAEFDRVRGEEPEAQKPDAKDDSPFAREDLEKMTFKELRDVVAGIDNLEVLSTDKKQDLVEKILTV